MPGAAHFPAAAPLALALALAVGAGPALAADASSRPSGAPGAVVPAKPSRRAPSRADRDRARAALEEGVVALEHGHPGRALDPLRRAVVLAPDAENLRDLGRAYEALGLVFKAEWAYRRCLSYADSSWVRSRLAVLKAEEPAALRRARRGARPNPKAHP